MEKFQGIIRHALTFLGGILVSRGIIDPSMVADTVGAVMTIVGLIWSIADKQKRI